ncbi:MAG: hypothetical protein II974_10690, partial [Firmicutes bacterium]|nr:hypothetical protein [Bacillota bacterium]
DIHGHWTDPYAAEYFCVVTDSRGQSVQSDTAGCRIVYRNTVIGPEQRNYRQRWYDAYTAGKPDTVYDRVEWTVIRRGESYSMKFYKDGVEIPGTAVENESYYPYQSLDLRSLGPGTYHAEVIFNNPDGLYGLEDGEIIRTEDFRYFIGEQPEEAVIPTGGSAELSFTTTAPGKAPFTYQWEKAETRFNIVLKDMKRAEHSLDILYIDEDMINHETRGFSDVEGATDVTLITDVPAAYRCRVTDADGYVSYTEPVFVYEQLRVVDQPVWTENALEEVGCRFEGGLWENMVHLQKYIGTWVDEYLVGGALEYDINGDHVSHPEIYVPCKKKGPDNGYVKIGSVKRQCGSGIYRFAIHDEFTDQWAYSEPFTIPDD